jgi:hypothetical protein
MTNEQAETLLSLIEDIVQTDDHQSWKRKVEIIKDAAKNHERWTVALDEFLAWFSD